jgi:DNA polymerase-3 subunit alpha
MEKNDKQFTNFKIHTQYSICEGAIKIDELSEYSNKNKIKSLGICDSFNLCGALEFSEKISKNGTQPIIGTQINFLVEETMGKLPIFAKSNKAYKNLIKLSSKSYLESDEKNDPHCKVSEFKNINKDLILLSGNHYGFFGKLFKLNKLKQIEESIKELKNIFKDRFYLEIQRHNEPGEKNYENFILDLSAKHQIPLIATQEVFYLRQDMHEAHDALVCIGEKNFVENTNRFK